MYAAFLPIPWNSSLCSATSDSIANQFIQFWKERDKGTGWKTRYSVASKEPAEIKGLTNVEKITIASERLENEGIVGKEGYQIFRQAVITIGYADDRIFVFSTDYGNKSPKDKTFKEKHKEFASFLKSFTIQESPRKNLLKSEKEGFYYVMNDTVPMPKRFKGMYFDQGMVYRKDNQFYEIDFPDQGKEVDVSKYSHDFLTLKDDRRLKPEFEKAMGGNRLLPCRILYRRRRTKERLLLYCSRR